MQAAFILLWKSSEPLPINIENPTTGRKIRIFFYCMRQKDPFGELFSEIFFSKFQRVHIFVKSRKVRNTASQSTKMADGICPKLYILNTPVQKEGNLPGFHIHTVCHLPFGHSSELKVILKKYVLSTSWPFKKYNHRNLIHK